MSIELSKIAKDEGIMLPEVAAARMRLFEQLKLSLLTDHDIQTIPTKDGRRSFIKRSGYRKLALAFNISDEIIKEEREQDPATGLTVWRIHVRASEKAGRSAVGIGACSTKERAFAHPDHDIYATAHTRAKNRAISDLIGSGEISAEEIEQSPKVTNETTHKAADKWFEMNTSGVKK